MAKEVFEVKYHDIEGLAEDMGDEAAAWLSKRLEGDYQLIRSVDRRDEFDN